MNITAVTYNFTDGAGQTASGVEVNKNFDDLVKVLNPAHSSGSGGVDGFNIDTSATNQVLVNTNNISITGTYTFSTNPIFNANAILDSYLSSNVMLLDAEQTITGIKTFDEPIEKLKIPILASHPTTTEYNNAIYELSSDGYAYIYKHGTGAIRLDYTDSYSGGAPNTYNGQVVIDENTPAILMIKGETGFTTASLSLIGINFPSYIYTELGQHSHSEGSLALTSGAVSGTTHTHTTNIGHTHSGTFASGTHTHASGNHNHRVDFGTHTHSFSDTTNSTGSHTHNISGNTGYAGVDTGNDGVIDHRHSMNFSSGSEGTHSHTLGGTTGSTDLDIYSSSTNPTSGTPSATGSISSYTGSPVSSNNSSISPTVNTTVIGSTAVAGISGNTLNDVKKEFITTAIKLYITQDISTGWGTPIDSGDLAGLLNINTANGTGDMDIYSYLSEGMNYIKIIDETVKTGGTLIYHCQTV